MAETVAFSDVLGKTPNTKQIKSDRKGCIREKSVWLWSGLMGKKGKQDCLTISASAAGAAAGNALSKHTATIGNLHDLLLAPADTSENQINL